MSTITINDANLAYNGKILFNNMNLTIQAGKITCLLGPSGVGKSTLLRIIANLIDAEDEGTFFTGSISCDDKKPLSQQLSYLAQQDALLPWLNALDNTLLGPRLRGESITQPKNLAEQLFNQLGLSNAKAKLPHELSGGMRQRVALIRTLIENKPILLMDEPFAALDAITRFELQTLICEYLQDRTVVLVTHDPMEALRVADDIYILSGSPAQLALFTHLTSNTPRNPDQPNFALYQAKLFETLSQAKRET